MTEQKNMQQKDIVIIGAGLTGLTMAYHLQKQGKNVLVVEKSSRSGGAICTLHEDGYVIETGPNTGSLANEEIVNLFKSLKNCNPEIANKDAHRRLIWKKGKLRALPSGIFSGFFTPLFSWKDKFGILLEPFRKKGTNPDESIADFAKRRLGNSFYDYAVSPFVSGIYAGNPEALAIRYALPKLYALEADYGSFIRGTIAKSKDFKAQRKLGVSKEVFSVEGGLNNLVDALVSEIGTENIILNANTTVLYGNSDDCSLKINEDEIQCTRIISTVGAHSLPELLPFVSTELMSKINNLSYATVVQVAVSISSDAVDANDIHAFGALFPSKENRKILGILYPSVCFKNRCPQGKTLLSVFIGGVKHPEMLQLPDDKIMELVKKELRIIYHRPELEPKIHYIARHTHAIPQYEKNTGERIDAIAEFEKLYPGISIAGNAIGGIGMDHRVKQAKTFLARFFHNSK